MVKVEASSGVYISTTLRYGEHHRSGAASERKTRFAFKVRTRSLYAFDAASYEFVRPKNNVCPQVF